MVGNWIDAHILQAEDQPYKAKSIKTFSFGKDGKFESSEELVGQTTPYMKEDWKFISWGTYDFKVILSSCPLTEKMPQTDLYSALGKGKQMEKDVKPTYDSTFSEPKIESITYKTLKEEFKRDNLIKTSLFQKDCNQIAVNFIIPQYQSVQNSKIQVMITFTEAEKLRRSHIPK